MKKDNFNWLKNKKVFQEGGRACFLYPNYIFCSSACDYKRGLWRNKIPIIGTSKGYKVNWFYLTSEEKDFNYTLKRVLQDKDFLQKGENELSNLVRLFKLKIKNKDFEKLTNKQLFIIYTSYINFYKRMGAAPTFLRQLDRAILFYFKNKLRNVSNQDEILATISYPTKPSYGRQEEVAILEASKSQKDKSIVLWRKFRSSSLGYFDEPQKDVFYFKDKIASIKNGDTILSGIKNEEKNFKIRKNKIKRDFDVQGKKIIDIAGRVVFTKDHYKFMINSLQYLGEPLFTEIARRTNEEVSFIKDLFKKEVEQLLFKNKIDKSLIKKRNELHVFAPNKENNPQLLIGKDASNFIDTFLKIEEFASEFKGRVACRGFGIGVAKVILSPKDFHKMNDGDILVVMNTSPDFVPIMKKAKAIVAEEGGITGHVSVVSREFGIPCIVGIRAVTDIIKDGDLVEVDAEKGVVTTLKRAK